jgi:hypothetical protein
MHITKLIFLVLQFVAICLFEVGCTTDNVVDNLTNNIGGQKHESQYDQWQRESDERWQTIVNPSNYSH